MKQQVCNTSESARDRHSRTQSHDPDVAEKYTGRSRRNQMRPHRFPAASTHTSLLCWSVTDVPQQLPSSSRLKQARKQKKTSAVTPATQPDSPPGEPDADSEDSDNARPDQRYTGHCDLEVEQQDCFNPDMVREMEFEDRAIWMGKWFAHHYAAWVSSLSMRELENYQPNQARGEQDPTVSPVEMLFHTFRRFQVPEDEWRSPLFSSPVCFILS